ncbi:MAG TPA: FAD:protein FMN transferase [Albitalea sp.]
MHTVTPPRHAAGALPPALANSGRRRLALGTALGACLVAWPLAHATRREPARLRESRPLMGTRVEIAALSADPVLLRSAVDAAFARMAELTAVMSHFEPLSRVSAINLAAGLQPVVVPPELMQVLRMAESISRRSEGAFDITIGTLGRWHFDPAQPQIPSPGYISSHLPDVDFNKLALDTRAGTAYLAKRGMRIDLGGIAKLYILQAGMDTLRTFGVEDVLINGGGDVLAASGPHQRPWRVGIRDPHRPQRLLASLDIRRGFVASSGDYERYFVRDGRRYHHVLDPRTGYPTQGPNGVTLVGESLDSVNGVGTAAMVLETRAGRELIRRSGVQALIAGRDRSLWVTPSLQERLLVPAAPGKA